MQDNPKRKRTGKPANECVRSYGLHLKPLSIPRLPAVAHALGFKSVREYIEDHLNRDYAKLRKEGGIKAIDKP